MSSVLPRELHPGPLPKSLRPRRPKLDGAPSRAVACLNLRHEDKQLVDLLHAFWQAKLDRSLSQWDVVSILLAAALENPRLDVPDIVRQRGNS